MNEEIGLVRALKRIAQGTRLSSFDVPIVEDAASLLHKYREVLQSIAEDEGVWVDGQGRHPASHDFLRVREAARKAIGWKS